MQYKYAVTVHAVWFICCMCVLCVLVCVMCFSVFYVVLCDIITKNIWIRMDIVKLFTDAYFACRF